MAQFGHDSLLNASPATSMMPPNIPLSHDLSNATADEMLEAAMAGQISALHNSLKRPSHTSYDTNSEMDFDMRKDSMDSSTDNVSDNYYLTFLFGGLRL